MPVLRVRQIDNEFSFWIPSLIICVISFSIVLYISLVRYQIDRNKENVICYPILALMFGFIIPWLSLNSLNVSLDFSTPTYEEFIILDKHVDTGARRITSYEVEVENEFSKFKIAIDEIDFYEYNIGDKITLNIYQGAFGKKYYLYTSRK